MRVKDKIKGVLSDGRYEIAMAYSTDIEPDAGRYTSPGSESAGIIIINPNQPEFDRDVALLHELDHHIAWTRQAKHTFTSHEALDYHATTMLCLFRNSPKLAEHFYLFHKGR